MLVLNLGCGITVSPRAVNIDFDGRLRLKGSKAGQLVARLTGRDWTVAAKIVYHDLRHGIPYPDDSADVVYHSHTLEHLDREHVDGFFAEIMRVLRPGGIHRIVVPDLEPHVRAIVGDLDRWDASGEMARDHETHIAGAIEQAVRRVPGGLRNASEKRRRIEMKLFGDARKTGQTHQWMWTRLSLTQALTDAGFVAPRVVSADESAIPDWRGYGLDVAANGSELHGDSLYVETTKPHR